MIRKDDSAPLVAAHSKVSSFLFVVAFVVMIFLVTTSRPSTTVKLPQRAFDHIAPVVADTSIAATRSVHVQFVVYGDSTAAPTTYFNESHTTVAWKLSATAYVELVGKDLLTGKSCEGSSRSCVMSVNHTFISFMGQYMEQLVMSMETCIAGAQVTNSMCTDFLLGLRRGLEQATRAGADTTLFVLVPLGGLNNLLLTTWNPREEGERWLDLAINIAKVLTGRHRSATNSSIPLFWGTFPGVRKALLLPAEIPYVWRFLTSTKPGQVLQVASLAESQERSTSVWGKSAQFKEATEFCSFRKAAVFEETACHMSCWLFSSVPNLTPKLRLLELHINKSLRVYNRKLEVEGLNGIRFASSLVKIRSAMDSGEGCEKSRRCGDGTWLVKNKVLMPRYRDCLHWSPEGAQVVASAILDSLMSLEATSSLMELFPPA